MTEIDLSQIHPNDPNPGNWANTPGGGYGPPADNPIDHIPNTITNPSAEGEAGGRTEVDPPTSSGGVAQGISASYNLHYLMIWAAFTTGLVLMSKIMPKITIGIAMTVLATSIVVVQREREKMGLSLISSFAPSGRRK